MGYWGERTVRRAMERVRAKAAPSKFNCLEITEVSAKQFWAVLRARLGALTAYPDVPISTRACRTRRTVVDADWATARTPSCRGEQSVWKAMQGYVPDVHRSHAQSGDCFGRQELHRV
jgi:hypothetical protein